MPAKVVYVFVLGAVFMLAPFGIDMYLPALPTIALDLNTGIGQLESTVAIFLFGYALGQLVLGPLSDAFGRRSVLIGGLVTYTLASVLLGTAQSIEELYIWRFVQAVGGAGSVVVFPMVREKFGETDSTRIISYIMALVIVAPLVAPIIGGYVLFYAGWGTIFFVLAALGVLTLVGSAGLIRNGLSIRKPFALRTILAGYGVVLAERRIVSAILAGGFAFGGLFAFVAGSPFVYITYFGVSPQFYGYLVGLNALAMIGANLVNAQLLAEIDPVRKTLAGAFCMAIAGVLLVGVSTVGLGLPWIVVGVVLFVAGLGLTETNAIIAALSVLPAENGTVSAINGALQFGVGALASLAVSLMISADAVPMTLVMAGSAILALISAVILKSTPVERGTISA